MGVASHLHDSLQAETVAFSAAIEGANNVGARRIFLESDSSNLVKALDSQD
jgi:ribonuclease HI